MRKANALPLDAGMVVMTQTGGGGGYGPPWKRSIEQVIADVRDGYVTLQGPNVAKAGISAK
jgi:N-methylhydantoinase B